MRILSRSMKTTDAYSKCGRTRVRMSCFFNAIKIEGSEGRMDLFEDTIDMLSPVEGRGEPETEVFDEFYVLEGSIID